MKEERLNEFTFIHRPVKDEVVEYVYATDDYERFSFSEHNRQVRPLHVKQIAESMREYGYDRSKPISVNVDFVVEDGQHRLKAAEEAGISVLYVIYDNGVPVHVSNGRVSARKWSHAEYLHHFASRGYPEYIALSKYLEETGMTIATYLFVVGLAGASRVEFENGMFNMARRNYAYSEPLKFVQTVMAVNPGANMRSYVGAFKDLLKIPGLEVPFLMDRVKRQHPWPLPPAQKKADALDNLVEIYNYKKAKKNKIAVVR